MPANWNNPVLTTAHADHHDILKERDVDALTLCVTDPTNIPESAMKYLRASNKFQERVAGAWVDKVLSIAGGGTGAASASAARTALGLGTMAVQNSNNVSITGGAIGVATVIDAGMLTVGTLPNARLNTDFQLPLGGCILWPKVALPASSKFLFAHGQAISRVTYADLFTLFGTTFGAGDGSTTFNLPLAAGAYAYFWDGAATIPGTDTPLATFGDLNHVHTGPSHTHTGPSHTHGFTTGVPTGANHDTLVDLGAEDTNVASLAHVHTGTTDAGGTGNTGASGTGNTGAANPKGVVWLPLMRVLW